MQAMCEVPKSAVSTEEAARSMAITEMMRLAENRGLVLSEVVDTIQSDLYWQFRAEAYQPAREA